MPLHKGSGMGLAQCRNVVEKLGGRIWIEGNGEGGTTVKFTLPKDAEFLSEPAEAGALS